MNEYLQLYGAFFKIGAFTFGGGVAMLPMLKREVVQNHGWATDDMLLDYFAIGQCTPGIIAVNTATFIGCNRKGIPGGIIATLGVITPSILIITAIAALLSNFMEIEWVQHMFAGIRVAASALIVTTVIGLIKKRVRSKVDILLCVGAFIATGVAGLSPMLVTLVLLATGVIASLVAGRRRQK